MRKLFGTDGIRGTANVYPMNVETAIKVGRGIAHILKGDSKRPKILIGKDTRVSGYMIENALASGICSMGGDVLIVGPMPTPGIAFLTANMRADAGIVISASHNPFQDNGIKIFARDGFKLPDEIEKEIESLILTDKIDALRPTADAIGKAFRIDDAAGRYIVFLKNTFPGDLDLEGVRVALDCAHGAAYKIAPAVFEELGAEVFTIGDRPNGRNINQNCGSLCPEVIQRAVRRYHAHIGVALDGDGDRVIFADEKGRQVDGDQIMAMCALDLMEHGELNKDTLVATVMSNMGLDLALEAAGGRVVKTKVGDRYVVEAMRKKGYTLGGEQSGHIIFLNHNTTGDGVITALQTLAIMKRRGKKLSQLAKAMTKYPQTLVNVRVGKKKDVKRIPKVARRIKEVEKELAPRGRVLIRYSGTEPVIRLMLEGEKESTIRKLAKDLAALIRKYLQ
jgi:phosphoglucosamine mutase